MIPFKNRFHGHSSLNYVYKNGHVVRGHFATIKFINNPRLKNSRVAVVISKKVLKSAVKRNRIRRRLYEYIRLKIPNFNNVYDLVLIVTSSELIDINHKDMNRQLDRLVARTKIEKRETKDVLKKS